MQAAKSICIIKAFYTRLGSNNHLIITFFLIFFQSFHHLRYRLPVGFTHEDIDGVFGSPATWRLHDVLSFFDRWQSLTAPEGREHSTSMEIRGGGCRDLILPSHWRKGDVPEILQRQGRHH